MKKLMILSVLFITTCLIFFFSISSSIKAQNRLAFHVSFDKASSNAKAMRLFNSGQMDSIGLQHLESACSMDEPPIIGRKNIVENTKKLYDGGFRFSNIRSVAKVITDSIAIDRGVWALNINSIPIATGTYLTQWHYFRNQWWIENEMSKTDKTINPEAFK